MSKYSINISGMHCKGCASLITISLEDVGMKDVVVDQEQHMAIFQSENLTQEVNNLLIEAFKDLKGYGYSDLFLVN